MIVMTLLLKAKSFQQFFFHQNNFIKTQLEIPVDSEDIPNVLHHNKPPKKIIYERLKSC